ncbi:hypothetical protein FACS1894160_3420 [Bacteroidia bacterium]|nr:hypothetical protein FACS1894160_3420 [Bacteroidia bacterium]
MKTKILYLFALVMAFTACEKEDTVPYIPPVPGSQGVFILNEGSWGGNDASLTYYNFETGETTADIFKGKLGDTAQDMIAYGGKLYITVTASNCIQVIDLYSFEMLETITGIQNPRYLAAYEGKVYATAYGATQGEVLKIDTTSLKVVETVAVGENPEGIAAANNKLYVANGGYGSGNTVSVINPTTFKEEKTITVRINPYIVKADHYGNIYLTTQGNFGYGDPVDLGHLQKINTQNDKVEDIDIPANQKFEIIGDLLYFYGVFTNYATGEVSPISLGVYNIATNTLTSDPIISIESNTAIQTPYAIAINPKTKDVYISDTNYSLPCVVYVFGSTGHLKNTIQAGVNANTFAFN